MQTTPMFLLPPHTQQQQQQSYKKQSNEPPFKNPLDNQKNKKTNTPKEKENAGVSVPLKIELNFFISPFLRLGIIHIDFAFQSFEFWHGSSNLTQDLGHGFGIR